MCIRGDKGEGEEKWREEGSRKAVVFFHREDEGSRGRKEEKRG